MTLRRLIDDLRRLGSADAALDKEVDLPAILDYCAIAGIPGASEMYAEVLLASTGSTND